MFYDIPRLITTRLSREALLTKYPTILEHANENDVFLDAILDHLMSRQKPIISDVQKQDIKAQPIGTQRFRRLLDYLRKGGLTEFIELCNGMEKFNTNSSHELSTELLTSLEERCEKWREEIGNLIT